MGIRRLLAAVLAAVMSMSMLVSPVFADGGDLSCSIITPSKVEAVEVNRGGSGQIDLKDYFTDSLGHDLTYEVVSADESLKARVDKDLLKVNPLKDGDFEVKVKAQCSSGKKTAEVLIPLSVVVPDEEGNPAQYNYDETDAESVTVYATISSDGIPLKGNDDDNTVLSHLKVTVPYFDLASYGLQANYRFHTKDGRGEYIDDNLIARPTGMHFFIYMTERYYMGLPEDECGKGTSGLLQYKDPCTMVNVYGEEAYSGNLGAYVLTGQATSTYMYNFWGHDENLMYYRNHFYPLMGPGWGATADYILLSDGDTMDVGLFTNWDFYLSGAFCCFKHEKYQARTGKNVTFKTLFAGSNEFGRSELKPITGLVVDVFDDDWNLIKTLTSERSTYRYVFSKAGTYHLIGRDQNGGTRLADRSPATADVVVSDTYDGEDLDYEPTVEEVEAMIDAIGEVTVEKEEKIKTARKGFDALPEEEQDKVDRKKALRLSNAEQELALLKYKSDNAGSEAVVDAQLELIKSTEQIIGKLIDDEEKIKKEAAEKEAADKAAIEAAEALAAKKIEAIASISEYADANKDKAEPNAVKVAALEAVVKVKDAVSEEAIPPIVTAVKTEIDSLVKEKAEAEKAAEEAAQKEREEKEKAEKEAREKEEKERAEREAKEAEERAAREAAEKLANQRKQGIKDINEYFSANADKMYEDDQLKAQIVVLQQILAVNAAEDKEAIDKAVQAVRDDVDAKVKYKEEKEAAEEAERAAKEAVRKAAKASKVTALKAKSSKQKFTVSWKKNASADGYDVQYKLSTASKFSVLKNGVTGSSVKTKKLKKNKKYVFRVRTYKKIDGEKICGQWVKTKAVKCK